MRNRGPQLKSLFALFERLIAKPSALARAVTFLGVSRSTVHRWREGIVNPRAENVLALDHFVRVEVVIQIADRLEGAIRSGGDSSPQPVQAQPIHRPTPEPEFPHDRDVFRTVQKKPKLPSGVPVVWQYAAAR